MNTKKAIIVGASSGIGRAIAQQLVGMGCQVGICARRIELLRSLHQQKSNAYIPCELDCTANNATQLLGQLVERLGGFSLFIFCAGIGDLNEQLEPEIEKNTTALNVDGFTTIIGWAYRFFREQGAGHLVNISSIAGIRGSRFSPSYGASKAYQINYLESLRQMAFRTKNPILITDVRPGFVATAMAKREGKFWVAPVDKAAQQIVSAILQKKGIVYITKRWRLIALFLKILPTWIHKRL